MSFFEKYAIFDNKLDLNCERKIKVKIVNDEKKRNAFILMHQLDTYLSNALLSSMRLMEVKKGEYLITQNIQATHLYCLVEGKLQIERYEINGEHVVFSFEQAFCVIGDLELFSAKDEMVFSTVQALVPSYLLALPLSIVRQKALQDVNFLTFICQQLSQKLYQSSLKHAQSPYSSEFKLRRYLFFKTQQEGLSFQLEKRDPLAAMLGISTRQLNRALAHLVSIKAITLKNKSITVLNCECLSYIDNSNE